jgi:hypothetical protein
LSIGSPFGIVFAYTQGLVPGSDNKKKGIIVAGILWFVLFLIPALEYPANPPGVGDPETIYYRQILYPVFLAISGFSVLGLAFMYRNKGARHTKNTIIIPALYAAIMSVAYVGMPANPDPINAPMDLVISFRIMSAIAISAFWGLLGVIFGAF